MMASQRLAPAVAAAAALLLAGCGDDGGTPGRDGATETDPDGEAGDGTPDAFEVEPPASPALPAPPVLTPCPAGWAEVPAVEDGGVATCEPWPEGGPAVLTPCPSGWRELPADGPAESATCDPWPAGGRADCAEEEAFFPGGAACERLGAACPTGEWPDPPPAGTVLYVRAGAAPGGSGTPGDPFGTVGAALAAALPGTTVLLGAGRFDEAVQIPAGVTLAGSCPAGTVLTATGVPESQPTLAVAAAGATVRDLRVEGDGIGIRVMGAGAELTVRDLVVTGVRRTGFWVLAGASLDAANVVLRDLRARADGTGGRGVQAESGATVRLAHAVIERSGSMGAVAFDPETSVTLADVAVLDTASDGDGTGGVGLVARDGGMISGERVVLERNREAGVLVSAGTVVLADTVVRDTRGDELEAAYGDGLWVTDGGRLEATRTWIDGNRDTGLFAADAGTAIALTDVVVSGTRTQGSDGCCGEGLWVQDRAMLTATRTAILESLEYGVFATDAGTRLELQGVVVRGTAPHAGALDGGEGLWIESGAALEGREVLLEDNHEVAVAAGLSGTEVALADAVIRRTEPVPGVVDFGRGLHAQGGAQLTLERTLVTENRESGLTASDAAVVSLTDVVVRDTLGQEADGLRGRGLVVFGGAQLTGERVGLERNRDIGVHVVGTGTRLAVDDLTVRDTQGTGAGSDGRGLNAAEGTRTELRRALFASNSYAGVVIGKEGATFDLEDLTIRDTEADPDGGGAGYGLTVSLGAQGAARRVRVERCRTIGLLVTDEGTVLALEDLAVEDMRSTASDGWFGTALEVQNGAQVTASRAALLRNRDTAVAAFGLGTRLALTDLRIEDTLRAECAETTCAGLGGGMGLGSYGEASVDVAEFVVSGNRVCGLQLAVGEGAAAGGTLDLHRGEVSGHPVAVNVQTEGFDVTRLQDQVFYLENDRNLDTSFLPVPEPGLPAEVTTGE